MPKKTEKYALLSVSKKDGVVDLAKELVKLNYKIISTGGTAKILIQNKIPVVPIQEITGNPESFDGRMKTISFQIESGILYDRNNPSHVKQAKELNIKPVDIVVCNLYPFEETVKNPKSTLNDVIENIDVGGPTMVRAAAKNFKNVLVIVNPEDYKKVISEIKKGLAKGQSSFGRKVDNDFRQKLAAKAFYHLSFYDSQIARFLNKEKFPNEFTLPGRKFNINLRYGENPHQTGALYFEPNSKAPMANIKHHWGRELGHVNITDINAGIETIRMFDEPAAVVIKHNTPCGIALDKTPFKALMRAIESDPISAFGGVIILNKPIDNKIAKVVASFKDDHKGNIDIIAAPAIIDKALPDLQKIRKSMGVYTFGKFPRQKRKIHMRIIDGGFLLQDFDDDIKGSFKDWKIVTKIKPTKKQLQQMQLAWKFVTRMRSNAVIVVDKNLPMTRGIGSGQTSRIESTNIALRLAGKNVKDAVLASDSFFPFDDSVKIASKYQIGAIVQQGGSVNDQLSIDAANKAGIPMIFTNRRAFWH